MSKFKLKFLFFILFTGICSALVASPIQLKENLTEAKAGHYVVILQGRNFSLLHIIKAQNKTLLIEEISAPAKLKSKIKGNWQNWIDQKAPGHISWVLYELNMHNCQIEEVYSCTQKSWKKVFPQEQIFPTLVDLEFTPIAQSKRKKVGPPVPGGLIDDRPLWQPPVIFEGKKLKNALCEAYSAYWPNDGTDLSGKKIEIFLAQNEEQIPLFFPIWMQVSDKVGHAKLRVIDSGTDLISPNKKIPLPPPQLSACHFTRKGDLQFLIKSHPSLENFEIYVREVGQPSGFNLPFSQEYSTSSRLLSIVVENEHLNNKLELDKLYTFIFEPKGYPHLSIETPKPIKLLKQYAKK